MSSFTHVVALASEVLSLSSELVSLSLYFFFRPHNFSLSHRNIALTLAIIRNIIGASDKVADNLEESPLLLEMFSFHDNSLLAKHYTAHQTAG
jgi:hypothetical protein